VNGDQKVDLKMTCWQNFQV